MNQYKIEFKALSCKAKEGKRLKKVFSTGKLLIEINTFKSPRRNEPAKDQSLKWKNKLFNLIIENKRYTF
jgi:hypothetical protein